MDNNQSTALSKFAGVQLFNAVGKRSESKPEETDVIIAEPTVGAFKVMPDVAEKLNIKDASFVTVQTVEIEGTIYVLIGKGKDGVLATNEDGSIKYDHRKRRVWDVDGFGATVSEATPGSNVLRFSVASAWKDLGCDGESRRVYKLGESIVKEIPVGEGEFFTTTLYELVHVRDEKKQEAKVKKAVESAPDPGMGDANLAEQPVGEENAYANTENPGTPVDEFAQGFTETDL